jgi:hypothetical protein
VTKSNDSHTLENASCSNGSSGKPPASRRLFSRDLNYLRDLFLAWPFVIFLIIGVASIFSAPHRQEAVRWLAVATVAILLAKERVVLLFAALGFIMIQSAITLVVHPWSWGVLAAGTLSAAPFLIARRYRWAPRPSYPVPDELGAVDVLWSVAAICATLAVVYFVSPYN